MESFNYIDIGIVILILLSAIVGFVRGFVREAISLATWIAAIAVAFIFFERLADRLPFNISNDLARLGISFVLLFLGVLILGSIINFLFNKAVHAIGLGGADRVLGGAFGVLRGALVVTLLVLLMGLGLTTFTDSSLWKGSKLVPHFSQAADWIKREIPEDVAEKLKQAASKVGITEMPEDAPASENAPGDIDANPVESGQ